MPSFPLLSTGAIAQYPSACDLEASTSIVTFVDGTTQAFRNYKRPRKRWIIRMHEITDQELLQIEEFWRTHGTTETFSFVDPWDGTEYSTCSIEISSLETVQEGPGRWRTNIVIRNDQV